MAHAAESQKAVADLHAFGRVFHHIIGEHWGKFFRRERVFFSNPFQRRHQGASPLRHGEARLFCNPVRGLAHHL